jgi:hypothetical protein
MEHEIPVLPVPSFGGAARDVWKPYRPELVGALRLAERVARRWENAPSRKPNALQTMASKMVDALFACMPKRCFVIMPFEKRFDRLFDRVIAPTVRAAGDHPIRLDRVGTPGDVNNQIEKGIRNCEYAIGVLDGLRHNVMYELGFAHGCSKITILLNHKGARQQAGSIPFDILTQQRIEYTALEELPNRLDAAIHHISTRRS